MTIPFFALTTRSLENVVQAELASRQHITVLEQAYRRVHGQVSSDGNTTDITWVPAADDIFIEVARWDNIRHTRDMLSEFIVLSAELDFQQAVEAIKRVRNLPKKPVFSVTASFVGKRNYNYHEIKFSIATGIIEKYPYWTYSENDDEADLNVRLFIEHQQGLVGVRLAEKPLHRRDYKQQTLEGSLKPPVAAAMVQLAELAPGQILLDPLCGSGTIVIEAGMQSLVGIGGDVNPEAIHISRANARDAETAFFSLWDATRLPLSNNSVHAVVSNLPWGRQITVNESLKKLYEKSFAEMRRALIPGGKIVLLTTLPELLPESPAEKFEVSVHGQNPQVMIFK